MIRSPPLSVSPRPPHSLPFALRRPLFINALTTKQRATTTSTTTTMITPFPLSLPSFLPPRFAIGLSLFTMGEWVFLTPPFPLLLNHCLDKRENETFSCAHPKSGDSRPRFGVFFSLWCLLFMRLFFSHPILPKVITAQEKRKRMTSSLSLSLSPLDVDCVDTHHPYFSRLLSFFLLLHSTTLSSHFSPLFTFNLLPSSISPFFVSSLFFCLRQFAFTYPSYQPLHHLPSSLQHKYKNKKTHHHHSCLLSSFHTTTIPNNNNLQTK